MTQPVRVGLFFPRSGQQVFVYVPPHVAEYVAERRGDHHLQNPERSSHPKGSGSSTYHENATRQ